MTASHRRLLPRPGRGALHLAPLLVLTACTGNARPVPAPAPAPAEPSEITYATSPCFGTCPVYTVIVRDKGRGGTFEGKRFTTVTGRRDFALDEAAFAAFFRALGGARAADPTAYVPGGKHCRLQATDHSSVTVTFRESGSTRTFPFYYGCRDPENAALATALREAAKALPIAGFIGS